MRRKILWKVGPSYEYFAGVLADMGAPETEVTIDHARRLWMRAQSAVLADGERRYGLARDDFDAVYRQVANGASAMEPPARQSALPPQSAPTEATQITSAREQASAVPADSGAVTNDAPISMLNAVADLTKIKTSGVKPEWQVQKGPTKTVCETADQYRTLARFLGKMLGSDDARLLRQKHVQELRIHLDTMPTSFGKAPAHWDMSFDDLIKEAEEKKKSIGRKPATINRWLTQLGSFLEYLETLGDIQIDRSKIGFFMLDDPELAEDKRQAFETEEERQLFSHAKWTGADVVHDSLYGRPCSPNMISGGWGKSSG